MNMFLMYRSFKVFVRVLICSNVPTLILRW